MTDHLKTLRDLAAALALIPADVKDDWGEYPSHDEAAERIGIYMNGSRVSKFGSVRLGMLAGCAPALAALLRVVEAAKELAESCNTFESTEYTPDGGWRRVLRKGYDPEKLIAFDAALRDLSPEVEDGE